MRRVLPVVAVLALGCDGQRMVVSCVDKSGRKMFTITTNERLSPSSFKGEEDAVCTVHLETSR